MQSVRGGVPRPGQAASSHPGRVACISLNCNYTGAADESPDAERPQIEAFLVKQRAEFDNLICTEPDHKLFEALDAAAIPAVRVYDRSGQLRQQFDNDDNEYSDEGFSYEKNITPLVEQLLPRIASQVVHCQK